MEKLSLVLIILIVVLIIAPVAFFLVGEEQNIKDFFQKAPIDGKDNELINSGSPSKENDQEGSGSAGLDVSSGGEGGSSDNSAQSFQTGCQQTQISYSLTNLKTEYVCTTFQNGECLDKTVNCSIQVRNLDYTTSGIFVVSLKFFEKNNEAIIFQEIEKSTILEPREFNILEAEINLNSPNANKEVDCNFRSVQIPKKEICS